MASLAVSSMFFHVSVGSGTALAAEEAAADGSFAQVFANAVDLESGLWSRWWFGDGDLSWDAIYKDMENLVNEGIVRIEVAKSFVWTNSENRMNAFYYVLKAADELGMLLDFATGNPYPAVTGTETLDVNGKVYYDPSSIGYESEKCDVKSMSYAYKEVGDGLDGADSLTGVNAWQSAGFMGSALTENVDISVPGTDGTKIFAVTANYIADDGVTILAGVDLTDNEEILSYTETDGLRTAASVTATPDALTALCTEEEQETMQTISTLAA